MPTVVIGANTGNDFSGCEDAFNFESSPTTNNNSTTLSTRITGGGVGRNTFVRFTGLSNLSNVTVTSAFIRMTSTVALTSTWTINECLREWVEAQVNWNEYSTGNSWASAGGVGTGDIDSDSAGSGSFPSVSPGDFDITLNSEGIAALQAWIDGTRSNHGFIFRTSGGGTNTVESSTGTDGNRPELHVTYTENSETGTAAPTTGAVTMLGRQPSVNPFTNVRLREVFINEAGSPLANMSGLSLLVWYAGAPIGAPDLSYSAVTTDANGTMSYSLATGSLAYNQAIFYVATDGSASLSAWTCARTTPTYS